MERAWLLDELKPYPVPRKALGVVLGLPKGNRELLEELQEPSLGEFSERATEKLISRKLFYQTNLSITKGRICQVKDTWHLLRTRVISSGS
jgi:hypothetical protein